MTELFLKLLNMSISAGWLVLMVLLLRLLLRKAPKWVNVLLWGLVAVRLLCPFTLESHFSLMPNENIFRPEMMMDTTPELTVTIPALETISNTLTGSSNSIPGMENPGLRIPLFNTPSPGGSVNPLQVVFAVLANIWVLGMIALLLYTLISYLRLRKKVAEAIPLKPSEDFLSALAGQMQNGKTKGSPAPIYQCERLSSPFVLGLFRPRIYLPFGIASEDLAPILEHELAHIRRLDHWWKPLGFLLLTLHWFNPLIWLAFCMLCKDIELACDESVIRGTGEAERASYSQAILNCSATHRSIAACPLAFGETGVRERVKSVLHYRKPAFWMVVAAILVCMAAALCFLTSPAEGDDSENTTITTGQPDDNTLQPSQGSSDSLPLPSSPAASSNPLTEAEAEQLYGQELIKIKEQIAQLEAKFAELLAVEYDENGFINARVNFIQTDVTRDGIDDYIETTITLHPDMDVSNEITNLDVLIQQQLRAAFATVTIYDGSICDAQNLAYPIWHNTYSAAHTGNGQLSIVHHDGQTYLLDSSLWQGQGFLSYQYDVFTLDKSGNQHIADQLYVEFSQQDLTQAQQKEQIDSFRERLSHWSKEGTLVVGTDVDLDENTQFLATPQHQYSSDEFYHLIWKRWE